MKFLATKELKDNTFLKNLLGGLLVLITLFLFLDLLLHHVQIGLSFQSAITTLLGNEEEFIEPLLFDSLLIMIHTNLFFSMLLLLILSAIWIRVSKQPKASKPFLHALFLLAIFAPIFLLLGYFFGAWGIKIWVVMFVLWHILALLMSAQTLIRLYKNG